MLHDIHCDASVPSWCEAKSDGSNIRAVHFSADAEEGLTLAAEKGELNFYANPHAAKEAIEQSLQLDIRSVHQGRGKPAADASAGQKYSFHFDNLDIGFVIFESHVLVTHCAVKQPT